MDSTTMQNPAGPLFQPLSICVTVLCVVLTVCVSEASLQTEDIKSNSLTELLPGLNESYANHLTLVRTVYMLAVIINKHFIRIHFPELQEHSEERIHSHQLWVTLRCLFSSFLLSRFVSVNTIK